MKRKEDVHDEKNGVSSFIKTCKEKTKQGGREREKYGEEDEKKRTYPHSKQCLCQILLLLVEKREDELFLFPSKIGDIC